MTVGIDQIKISSVRLTVAHQLCKYHSKNIKSEFKKIDINVPFAQASLFNNNIIPSQIKNARPFL